MSGNRPSSRGSLGPRVKGSSRPGARPSGRVAEGTRGTGRAPGRSAGRASSGPSGRRGAARVRSGGGPAAPRRPRFTGRAAILVLVVAVLMVSYASSLRAYFEQRDHLASLHADIAASEAEIASLEREKARWDDPSFVRSQARLRFGWVLPGEIGYQVLDEDGTALESEDTLSDPVPETTDDQPLWWQSAWDSVEAAGRPEDLAAKPKPADQIRAPRSAGD